MGLINLFKEFKFFKIQTKTDLAQHFMMPRQIMLQLAITIDLKK